MLACCRVVAVLDEIQDCIEEAPDTLTATTTPRFLERVFGIALMVLNVLFAAIIVPLQIGFAASFESMSHL